jgi:peptidoglycan-associated lipoprotein
MTPIIRSLCLLGLSALVALACASTSSLEKATPKEDTTKAPEEATIEPAATPSLEPVYFATDEAVLHEDARAFLKAHAEAIKKHPEMGVVTIQGHCDERGSDEYNLALGKRRAAAVKRYLMSLGVPSSRLDTMSYGESRPAVPGHDESAWRYNRRSELKSSAIQSANR